MLQVNPWLYWKKAKFHAEKVYTLFDGSINTLHHAYLSWLDNGTYTLREMLNKGVKPEFIKAMESEISDYKSRNHWSLMPRSNMPNDAKLHWQFDPSKESYLLIDA